MHRDTFGEPLKQQSKSARFRERMANGCPVYQRAIEYYPCPRAEYLTEEDLFGKCDHERCYELALERGTDFVRQECISELVGRRKFNLLRLIWRDLKAAEQSGAAGGAGRVVLFSAHLWFKFARMYVSGLYFAGLICTAHKHGMLRPAVQPAAELVSEGFARSIDADRATVLRELVEAGNADLIHTLADVLPEH